MNLTLLTAAATALKNASVVQMDGENPKPVEVFRPIDKYVLDPDPVVVAFQGAARRFTDCVNQAVGFPYSLKIPQFEATPFVNLAHSLADRAGRRVQRATADAGLNTAIDTLVSNVAARLGWV